MYKNYLPNDTNILDSLDAFSWEMDFHQHLHAEHIIRNLLNLTRKVPPPGVTMLVFTQMIIRLSNFITSL